MPGLLLLLTICADDGVCPTDRWRFPLPDSAVQHHAKFAAAHLEWAAGTEIGFPGVMQVGMNADFAWVCDARRRANAWRFLKDAREAGNDAGRIQALAQLRRLLGDEDYGNGFMPDPVPWKRFRIVD